VGQSISVTEAQLMEWRNALAGLLGPALKGFTPPDDAVQEAEAAVAAMDTLLGV
jgi:hypothetical protein